MVIMGQDMHAATVFEGRGKYSVVSVRYCKVFLSS